ncbi:N-acetyltransferase [Fibrisoma montanum]|uniref:N-acetyltransferase n=1 Tax=Fibrisoma montanum TaxID=2305895 RepID=A0A418M631_9BACT|nr:GNAT family N-acetyltransferase [Fibrisoma montanum]RIV21215.1 N-acetyltransferase [Fibrisoma montanum]
MHLITRNLRIDDYEQLKAAMIASYSGLGGPYWRKERIETLLHLFPKGQFCVVADGQLVACALSIIVHSADFGRQHTYEQVTGQYTFDTHDPAGDVLYGVEVFVQPGYRGLQLGRRLYEARKTCCRQLNLRGILAGGRIPAYHLHSNLTPQEYIDRVKLKEIYDPTLSFQLANGFCVKQILPRYLRGDLESREYATLLEWEVCSVSQTDRQPTHKRFLSHETITD